MTNKKTAVTAPTPKVVKTKIYTVTEETFDNGRVTMTRRNDGFETFALLGILDFIRGEVVDFIKGAPPKIDHVKRELVVDKKGKL